MTPVCRDCLYYTNEGYAIGTCNRYPTAEKKYKDNWCGEFKESEDAK